MFSIPFNVDRHIIVNKPVQEVYRALGDFNNWGIWSPWIIQESDCPVTVSESPVTIGHKQAWQGKRIGSGNMELIGQEDNKSLSYDLNFIAPWKSHSTTQFELESVDSNDEKSGTKITWKMQGTLPFFLFFMKKIMTAMINSDYDRGLKMFKQYIETGGVSSSVDIKGVNPQQGFYYLGYRKECHVSEISKELGPCFQKLFEGDCLPDSAKQPDFVLTVINKFDFVSGNGDMVAAVAYKNKPNVELPADMILEYMPEHKALEVLHTGSYNHLANGWATIMGYQRFAKLKANKKVKEYEVYLNSPEEVSDAELETAIFVPVK